MGKRSGVSAVNVVFGSLRRQSKKVKIAIGIILFLFLVVFVRFTHNNQIHFFAAAEFIHTVGIFVLIYKLTRQKTCSGDIHTYLDLSTLISTLWVICMIRFKLNSSYSKELDNFRIYYLVVPCVVIALLIHPDAPSGYITCVMWALCVYLESVSVLPQLRLMQNAKMIEPFTAHYVFALGIARFLSFANWLIQFYGTRGHYLWLIEAGYLWFPVALLAEFIQTFILADFCYYYIKSVMEGQLVLTMPV